MWRQLLDMCVPCVRVRERLQSRLSLCFPWRTGWGRRAGQSPCMWPDPSFPLPQHGSQVGQSDLGRTVDIKDLKKWLTAHIMDQILQHEEDEERRNTVEKSSLMKQLWLASLNCEANYDLWVIVSKHKNRIHGIVQFLLFLGTWCYELLIFNK